jgi:hypothetical protein
LPVLFFLSRCLPLPPHFVSPSPPPPLTSPPVSQHPPSSDAGRNNGANEEDTTRLEETDEERTKGDQLRSEIEASVAAAGHPSIEAWLRALTPPQLDMWSLDSILYLALVNRLGEVEMDLAIALFNKLIREDPAPFHPSLLVEDKPAWGSAGELLPCSLWQWSMSWPR